MSAPLGSEDLFKEAALLERVLYKNKNQHRRTSYFKRLLEVRRFLRLLKVAVDGADDPQRAALRTKLLRDEATFHRLKHQLASMRLAEALAPALLEAASQLSAQLSMGFFVPFCVTCFALLARIQVLSAQLMLEAAKHYNALAATAGLPQDLPSLVKIEWQGPLPQLALTPQQAVPSNVPAPATGSAAMAAAQPAAEDLGTVIDRRSVASPAAGVMESDDVDNDAAEHVAAHTAHTPMFELIDDRAAAPPRSPAPAALPDFIPSPPTLALVRQLQPAREGKRQPSIGTRPAEQRAAQQHEQGLEHVLAGLQLIEDRRPDYAHARAMGVREASPAQRVETLLPQPFRELASYLPGAVGPSAASGAPAQQQSAALPVPAAADMMHVLQLQTARKQSVADRSAIPAYLAVHAPIQHAAHAREPSGELAEAPRYAVQSAAAQPWVVQPAAGSDLGDIQHAAVGVQAHEHAGNAAGQGRQWDRALAEGQPEAASTFLHSPRSQPEAPNAAAPDQLQVSDMPAVQGAQIGAVNSQPKGACSADLPAATGAVNDAAMNEPQSPPNQDAMQPELQAAPPDVHLHTHEALTQALATTDITPQPHVSADVAAEVAERPSTDDAEDMRSPEESARWAEQLHNGIEPAVRSAIAPPAESNPHLVPGQPPAAAAAEQILAPVYAGPPEEGIQMASAASPEVHSPVAVAVMGRKSLLDGRPRKKAKKGKQAAQAQPPGSPSWVQLLTLSGPRSPPGR